MIDYKSILSTAIQAQQSSHPNDWNIPVSAFGNGKKNRYAQGIKMAVVFTRLAINEKNVQAANFKRYMLYCALFGRVVQSTYDLTVGELYGFLSVARGGKGAYGSDDNFIAYLKGLTQGAKRRA